MIASAFPQGAGWAWEVLGPNGEVLANGHAPTAGQARRVSTRAWLEVSGGPGADLAAHRSGTVGFGGAWGR